MKLNPAHTLLRKTSKLPVKYRVGYPRKSYVQCFLDFESYLQSLCKKHLKRSSYSKEYIIGQILQTKISTENWNVWNKKQLFAAYQTCIRMRESMVANKMFDANGIKKHEFLIRNLIHDLKPFIEHLESTETERFVLFEGGKTNVSHSWENYHFARQLYFNSVLKENHFDSKTALIASPFVLRHAIEMKMKRIIGIEDVFNATRTLPRLKHEFMFEFVKEHQSNFEFKDFQFSTIRQIFDWCNIAVHYGIMPRHWEIETALDYCRPFLSAPKQERGFDINGAVKVSELQKVRDAYEAKVNSMFPSETFYYVWSNAKNTESVIVS